MATPDLIYCAGGNRAFAQVAIDAGFKFGSQLPETIYHLPYFADQDWKKPNRVAYMAALEKYRPTIASVMDWERDEQLPEVLSWSEEAAQYVEVVMIIPKVHGGVTRLPRFVGGKQVHLGYSVPTRYGGTELMLSEFIGWPVHLLGGSPGQQMYLSQYLNVTSVDGNMAAKLARSRCLFWTPGKRAFTNRWTSLLSEDDHRWSGDNAPLEAFRRSCANIMAAWRKARA